MADSGVSSSSPSAGGSTNTSSSTSNDSSSSLSSNDNGTTAETISQSPSIADTLSSSPTTADTLSGKAAIDDANVSKDGFDPINESFDLVATKNPHFNAEVASFDLKAKAPAASIDTEKSKASASAGKLDLDVTALRATVDFGVTELADVSLVGNVKTVNANATLAGSVELNGSNSQLDAKASAGAEAMALDGKASIDVSLTPKAFADTITGVYNDHIDPLIDKVAGYDIPDLPEAPDSWDKGVALSGYVEGGFGASAKGHFGLEAGRGTKNKISGGGKLGAGPVFGFGGSVGLKLN